MKYYWKVVIDNGCGEYVSSWARNGYQLRYKIGKWTVPNIGKIFIFETRKQAREYKSRLCEHGARIFKVRADGVVEYDEYIPNGMDWKFAYNLFWAKGTRIIGNRMFGPNGSVILMQAPNGTCFAKKVKPVCFA